MLTVAMFRKTIFFFKSLATIYTSILFMYISGMIHQIVFMNKTFLTVWTFVYTFMSFTNLFFMLIQIILWVKSLLTNITLVIFVIIFNMWFQVFSFAKKFSTGNTPMFVIDMTFELTFIKIFVTIITFWLFSWAAYTFT